MSDTTTRRTQTGSTIRVRIDVTDREAGGFTDVEVAVSEIAERVMQADEGDRYAPVLSAIESVVREATNKTLAQVVAFEHVAKLREDANRPATEPTL